MDQFTLGMDIGITSIGWSVIDTKTNHLVDLGVHLFEEAKPAADARNNRQARRTLRRKKWRKEQLKKAFVDFHVIMKEEIMQPGFLSFTTDTSTITRPKDETIYHLRKRALQEQVSFRELLLALYNICGTRGHFLMENVNFDSQDGITFALFKERFYDAVSAYVEIENQKAFEEKILQRLFTDGKIPKKEIKQLLNEENLDEEALEQLLYLLSGYKANLSKISESVALEDTSGNVDILTLIKKEETNDFLECVIELHDMIEVSKVLQQYQYICELDVDKLNHVKEIYALEQSDAAAYKEAVKSIQSKMKVSSPGKKLRVIKNIENKYPNGLYVKEARAILRKQQSYYPTILTDSFIEVCITIMQARIPYFIGPLSENAKNAWLVKKGNFRYSYAYSCKDAVDEYESIRRWKLAMISHCTYLPKEFALPKGSFIAETFHILNELNVLQAVDKNENRYYLTLEDKLLIFDQLFLKNTKVNYQEVAALLGLKTFGTRKNSGSQKFRSCYTLYHSICSILPQLAITSITELFEKSERIEQLENIILNINLFDEETSKSIYFQQEMGFDERSAKKLSKLKSNGFYAFSKKFLLETPINEGGQCLIDALFNDNCAEYTNEQMTLISQAKDQDGKPLNFAANKYMEKLNKNPHLSIDLLIENGKPFIPISRPVIRALNECFKLYEEIIHTYGVPARVVIETARDLKDSSRQGEVPAKHFDEMKRCYHYLEEQLKQPGKKLYAHAIEDWEEVSSYLSSNKRKIELYIRQNGLDMISGDPIDLHHLQDYEMDHVLPRGFGDNSMDNMILIHKVYNSAKGDRVPLEYIEQDLVKNKAGKVITSSDFIRRVNELFDLRMISEKKVKQLMLSSSEEVFGFINRNLVDTRYIIRELMAILRAYNAVNDYPTHIVSLRSAFTSVYRQALRFKKNRDIGSQHHAHDAAIVSIADQVLSTYYPNYDQRGNQKNYQNFLQMMQAESDPKQKEKSEQSKLNTFIEIAYWKTYGDYPAHPDSLVSQIKSTTPLYSIKAEKNYKGEFFNATILKPSDIDPRSPLSILGVNNAVHAFSSINCAAVDFYKYTTKKGKKKHVAIHIPKVIIHSDGTIDKEKYIRLIRDYYKETDLLDENGNLKEYYFCIRAFKNDLIYDTQNQVIQKFNIGSIAKKKLELKHIYQFSYNAIYEQVAFFRKALSIHFDFKLAHIHPSGQKKFQDVDIHEMINFCVDNLMEVQQKERYYKGIVQFLEKETNFQTFLEKAAFLNLVVNRPCTWPMIFGQFCPTASAIGEEARYIKIKSSILGIRYAYNEKGTLLIDGPKGAVQKYSKIKKEAFSWKICKSMVE
ncbi:type II CRISPR RNA-guided endonuclease Cas9 [Merdibacter massiliensis]|uniref:type II CRISPR RNA-guided endonuclease Cas9 n=1 Tax=Merdibacter massiliensis TaxID=1871030 RepID=UPI00096AB111|nr:type II CRISPR RNA-guided endonuclease Cas9 [Merdibacter massiliensis]